VEDELFLAVVQLLPDDNAHLMATFQDNLVSRYQNVSILDFIGAKDDGGDGDKHNCSYKTCKAPVIMSSSTNQHTAFHRLDVLPVT